jgi:hypothetical protein
MGIDQRIMGIKLNKERAETCVFLFLAPHTGLSCRPNC